VSNPGTLFSNTVNVTFVTPLTVSPATAKVALGASKTFSVSGQTVAWSASAGSITSAGVYTAHTTMPASSSVTITASSSGGQTGTATVTLTQPLTQVTFNAASVFSYYAPNYVVPAGYILPLPATQPTGGEFQIFDTYTSIYRANLVTNLFGSFSSPLINYGPGTSINLSSYQALWNNPTALVNAMDQTLTRGMLPANIKSIIANAVAAEDPAGYTNGMKQVEAAPFPDRHLELLQRLALNTKGILLIC
jgi:hypothetical protein